MTKKYWLKGFWFGGIGGLIYSIFQILYWGSKANVFCILDFSCNDPGLASAKILVIYNVLPSFIFGYSLIILFCLVLGTILGMTIGFIYGKFKNKNA